MNIQQAKKDVDRFNAIAHELINLDEDLKRQELMVDHAYNALQKEKNDVIELDDHAISKAFMKLANTYEGRREKEVEEQRLAEEQFVVARKHLMDLRSQKQELIQEKDQLKGVREVYMTLLKEKTIRMQDDDGYLKFRADILQHQYAMSYHEQNMNTCKDCLKTLEELKKRVESIFSGAVIDLVGVPLVGDAIKYSQTNEISDLIDRLNENLRLLNSENAIDEDLKQNNPVWAMFDLAFDNIVSDAISVTKIHQLKEKLNEIEEFLNKKIKTSRRSMNSEKKEVNRISGVLEDYIVNYTEKETESTELVVDENN